MVVDAHGHHGKAKDTFHLCNRLTLVSITERSPEISEVRVHVPGRPETDPCGRYHFQVLEHSGQE